MTLSEIIPFFYSLQTCKSDKCNRLGSHMSADRSSRADFFDIVAKLVGCGKIHIQTKLYCKQVKRKYDALLFCLERPQDELPRINQPTSGTLVDGRTG